jgi:hypothetical protein
MKTISTIPVKYFQTESTNEIKDQAQIWVVYSLGKCREINDVVLSYEFINEVENDLSGELTKICMLSAESSFAEFWDNEDDNYWESY